MRKPNLVLSIFVSGLFPQGTAAKKEEIRDGLKVEWIVRPLYLNLSNKTLTQAKAVPTWQGKNKRKMSKATLTNGSTPHQINVRVFITWSRL